LLKIAYTLTLWNERPAIKLPISVHYHNGINIYCVDTDFGSTDQRSDLCEQQFVCKKIKPLVKLFQYYLMGKIGICIGMCALNSWPADQMEHIFRIHTNRSSIGVSIQLLVSSVLEERPVPWFQVLFCYYNNYRL